jgi:hypothetical protein
MQRVLSWELDRTDRKKDKIERSRTPTSHHSQHSSFGDWFRRGNRTGHEHQSKWVLGSFRVANTEGKT